MQSSDEVPAALWSLNEEESRPFIKRALELGINFFDTANIYSDGTSEEIVGRALKDFGATSSLQLLIPGRRVILIPGPHPKFQLRKLSTNIQDTAAQTGNRVNKGLTASQLANQRISFLARSFLFSTTNRYKLIPSRPIRGIYRNRNG